MKLQVLLFLTICLYSGMSIGNSETVPQETRYMVSKGELSGKSLATMTKQFIESAREGVLDYRSGIGLSDRIAAEVQLDIIQTQEPNTPQARRSSCVRILGVGAYQQIEDYCIQVFRSSKKTEDVFIALNMLGKALSSEKGKPLIKEKCVGDLRFLMDDDEANDPSPTVLFAVAESLCYLGDDAGIEVLSSVIGSENTTASMKCASLRALFTLSSVAARATLMRFSVELLKSDNAAVAYCAFDGLAEYQELDDVLISMALYQLENLSKETQQTEFDDDSLILLGRVSRLLAHENDTDSLSAQQKATIKKSVLRILQSGKSQEQERVASLFSRLAESDDKEIINNLLKSSSPRVRTEGVRSILGCDASVKNHFLPDLVERLDAPDLYERDLALYVIRQIKGEKATNLLPEREFQQQADRIKSWWVDYIGKTNSAVSVESSVRAD